MYWIKTTSNSAIIHTSDKWMYLNGHMLCQSPGKKNIFNRRPVIKKGDQNITVDVLA